MKSKLARFMLSGLACLTLAATHSSNRPVTPDGAPEAIIDLGSESGVKLVDGQWRYSDTKIVETDFRGPGPDRQPTGGPVKTYDYTPHAGGGISTTRPGRRSAPPARTSGAPPDGSASTGIASRITIPETIGSTSIPAGSTAVFETSLDDYAEIWVDGELTRALGQSGGSVISGWNAANRLVIGRDVKPGQKIQLAVFGINGPISNPPTNFICMRHGEARVLSDDSRTRSPSRRAK